jgi:hypothetical protein
VHAPCMQARWRPGPVCAAMVGFCHWPRNPTVVGYRVRYYQRHGDAVAVCVHRSGTWCVLLRRLCAAATCVRCRGLALWLGVSSLSRLCVVCSIACALSWRVFGAPSCSVCTGSACVVAACVCALTQCVPADAARVRRPTCSGSGADWMCSCCVCALSRRHGALTGCACACRPRVRAVCVLLWCVLQSHRVYTLVRRV